MSNNLSKHAINTVSRVLSTELDKQFSLQSTDAICAVSSLWPLARNWTDLMNLEKHSKR